MKMIMNKYFGLVAAMVIFLLFAGGYNTYRTWGDGRVYYAFTEKLLSVSDPESGEGVSRQYFSQCGSAFFNAPFYLVGRFAEHVIGKTICVKGGITLRTIACTLGSNFYFLLSMVLVFMALKREGFMYINVAMLCIFFSTSAFFITCVVPLYAHAVDIFCITVFWYLLVSVSFDEEGTMQRRRHFFFIGLWYPIMVLVRYANCVLIIPVLVDVLIQQQSRRKCMYLLFGGLCVTAWIIPLVFYVYNGGIFHFSWPSSMSVNSLGVNPYVTFLQSLSFFPKYALKLLAHPLRGIFVWSPVTLFSFLGLFGICVSDNRGHRRIGYLSLGMFVSLVMMYGLFSDWYAGWSFSNRYLVGLFAVYVTGLSWLCTRHKRLIPILAIVCTCYSLFLFFNWYMCIVHGEFSTPYDMIHCWFKGENMFGGDISLRMFFEKMWQWCRYKYILRAFF